MVLSGNRRLRPRLLVVSLSPGWLAPCRMPPALSAAGVDVHALALRDDFLQLSRHLAARHLLHPQERIRDAASPWLARGLEDIPEDDPGLREALERFARGTPGA